MATNEAKVIISAEDKTKAGINSVQKSFSSFTSVAKKLGGVLATTFAIKKVIDFGISSVTAFAEAESQMSVFNTTLRNMGQLGESMRDSILSASDTVLRFGFDNEDAAVAMARFARQTGELDTVIKMNQFTMDLARTKNISYAEAAEVTTMALGGQMRGLRDLGFVADDTLTPLENIAKAQEMIKGQAEAFAGTPIGAMQAFQSQWGELKESIGQTLTESLLPFLTSLNGWLSDPKNKEDLQMFIHGFGVLFKGAIMAVKFAFDTLFGIVSSLWMVLKELGGWISDVFMRIVDVFKSGFAGAVIQIEKAVNAVKNLIDAIKSLNLIQGAKNVGGKIVSSITGLFKADGGPVSANNPYIVGERGPELFVPNASGSILPNNRLAGAGNITINITGNTLLDGSAGDKLAAQIMRTLKQNLRI